MIKHKIPLIIDTDPGIDDAVALSIALFAPIFDLKLITTVSGNVGIEDVTNNVLKLLTFFKQNVPVARGAAKPLVRPILDGAAIHGVTGMGDYVFEEPFSAQNLLTHDAVTALKETLNASEEKVTIVVIGPETNIARLIQTHPEVLPKIKELIIMGGALGRGNRYPLAEYNIVADPEAAKIVLQSGLKLTYAPVEVGYKTILDLDDITKMTTLNKTGAMLATMLKSYQSGNINLGLRIYDITTICYLLKPEYFTVAPAFVYIETDVPYLLGTTVIDFNHTFEKPHNALILTDISTEQFKAWFFHELAKLP